MRIRLTAVAFAALLLTGCTAASAPGLDEIESVEFSQSQAVPDFDDGEYTQDDRGEIAEFVDLLRQYDVDPATYRATGETCPGGRETQVAVIYAERNLEARFRVDSCDVRPFAQAADQLFTEWREELSGS